jgi:RHS repeat-associated protein
LDVAEIGTFSTVWFGVCRNSTGNLPTDKLFTGQRLDTTGLYYYEARYYDPSIGRFISPDTIVQNPSDPQTLNRYTYCSNNPLRYTDPTGHGWGDWFVQQVNNVVNTVTDAWNTIQPYVQPAVDIAIIAITVVELIPSRGGTSSLLSPEVSALSQDTSRLLARVENLPLLSERLRPEAERLSSEVAKTFRSNPIMYQFKPGDMMYRASEEGKTDLVGRYMTDFGTASHIKSTQSAVSELALKGTSNANPDRMAGFTVTRPFSAPYGLVNNGGQNAYQFYIDPKNFSALEITSIRPLK